MVLLQSICPQGGTLFSTSVPHTSVSFLFLLCSCQYFLHALACLRAGTTHTLPLSLLWVGPWCSEVFWQARKDRKQHSSSPTCSGKAAPETGLPDRPLCQSRLWQLLQVVVPCSCRKMFLCTHEREEKLFCHCHAAHGKALSSIFSCFLDV